MSDSKDPIIGPGRVSGHFLPWALLATGLLAFIGDAVIGGAAREHPATFISLAGSLLAALIAMARTRMLELANHHKLHAAVVYAFGGRRNEQHLHRQWFEARLVGAVGTAAAHYWM